MLFSYKWAFWIRALIRGSYVERINMAGRGDSYTVYLYSVLGQGNAANCRAWLVFVWGLSNGTCNTL